MKASYGFGVALVLALLSTAGVPAESIRGAAAKVGSEDSAAYGAPEVSSKAAAEEGSAADGTIDEFVVVGRSLRIPSVETDALVAPAAAAIHIDPLPLVEAALAIRTELDLTH